MCSVTDILESYKERCKQEKGDGKWTVTVANALQIGVDAVYRKFNQNDIQRGLHAVEIPPLCNGLGDYRLLHAVNAACGYMALRIKPLGDVDLAKFTMELEEALAVTAKALADGEINTKQEAHECLPELLDLIGVASDLARQCQVILNVRDGR